MTSNAGWHPDPWHEHDRRWWDGSQWTSWVADPPEIDPETIAQREEIAGFLADEAAIGALDPRQLQRLLSDLSSWTPGHGPVSPGAPTIPSAPAGPAAPARPEPPAARPEPARPVPVALLPPPPRPPPPTPTTHLPPPPGPRPGPSSPPATTPPIPPTPPATPTTPAWPGPQAPPPARSPITTELAVHGLAYLGVALVLTGVFGFVVFAFGDLGEPWRPLAELATAGVLFGSGAFLRRRGVPFVGDALVLLGGLVTPILVVAAFVDGVPVPPDLTGRGLALALTPVFLAIAALFAVVVHRRAGSPLRFLVAPMLWWAAAAAGLAFSGDDPGGRDVVTPMAAQWALVTVVVAGTLWAARMRPGLPLAAPTRFAGLIGLPLAELIVLLAAAASGWPAPPVLVAGLATLLGIEALSTARPLVAANLQGATIVVTGAACVSGVGLGWAAAGVAVTLVGLVERTLWRRADTATTATWLSIAAATSVLALTEPVAALVVAGVAMGWSLVRLERTPTGLDRAVPAIGVFASPLLALVAAELIWTLAWGLVGLAAVALLGSIVVRVRHRSGDPLAPAWVLAQVGLVTVLMVADWSETRGGEDDLLHTVALAGAALAVWALTNWPCLRVWLTTTLAAFAGVNLALFLELGAAEAATIASAIALALVLAGQPRPLAGRGHVALAGHAVGLAALLVAVTAAASEAADVDDVSALASTATTSALVAGALGWAVSTAVGEHRGSASRDLWIRIFEGRWGDDARFAPSAEAVGHGQIGAVVPAAATVLWWMAIPPTVLVAADALDATDPWLAVSAIGIALAAVLAARAVAATRMLLARTWAGALWAAALVAPAAAGSRWALVTAAGAVVVMAAVSGPILGNLATVTAGWIASGVVVTALASALGLSAEHLDIVVLGWASVALLGSLALDDRLAGRREVGQLVRRRGLWPPFVLGAVVAPSAVLAGVGGSATVVGWTVLGFAGVSFAAAGLVRLAWVSVVGWASLVVGLGLVAPWDPWRLPWTLVPAAGVLLLAAEVARAGGRADPAIDLDRRWDLPPFAVAQALLVSALALSTGVGWVPATWLGVAATWATIGIRLRSPWWIVAGVPVALVGAGAAGPGWLTLALTISTVGAAAAATRSSDGTRNYLQIATAVSAATAFASFGWWQSWDVEEATIASAVLAAAGLSALAVGVRWLRLGLDWLVALVGVPLLADVVALLLVTNPDVPRTPARLVVAAGLGATATAAGVLARPTRQGWLRETAAVGLASSLALAADGLTLTATAVVVLAVCGSVAAVAAGAVLLESRKTRAWSRPALLFGGLLLGAALTVAATQLPDRPLLVLAFGAGGVELLGIGVVSRRVEWLAAAPWAFLAAWVTFASGALTGDPQWFTVPVGLTILGVIGIVRWSRRRDGVDPALEVLSVSELLGMVLLVGPALVESVTRSPAYGLLAAGIGLALAVFGALTRVRRRLAVGVAGLLVALLLMVVPPLLELVPPLEGSVPWIILAVVGLLALFTAAFLEKGRQLAHRGVRAVAELTRGWE